MLDVEKVSLSVNYWRYSATGNTFLIFDNRDAGLLNTFSSEKIQFYCEKYNTDGVIFLQNSDEYHFHMRYLNRDGGEVEMCGNGTRSITHFAHHILNISCDGGYRFSTYSGVYCSKPIENFPVKMTELKEEGLIAIDDLYPSRSCFYVNTGVPHCCFEVDEPDNVNLLEAGAKIRYDKRFVKGANANFFSHNDKSIVMRTYERGVEGETLSCGTGAVAVVITLLRKKGLYGTFHMNVPGGKLIVECSKDGKDIWLAGPVVITKSGDIDLS